MNNSNGNDRLDRFEQTIEGMLRVQQNLVQSDANLMSRLDKLADLQTQQNTRIGQIERLIVNLQEMNQARMSQIEQQHLDLVALARSNRDILAEMQRDREGGE